MGEITPDMRDRYPLHYQLIPTHVLERIDEDEILDRLDAAADLHTKADGAPRDLAQGYRDRVRALCAAEPRDDTQQLAREWLDKADGAASALYKTTCLEQAAAVDRANPKAERRTRPGAEERRRAMAVAKLEADVAKAVAAKRAEQAAADTELLTKMDASPGVGVTRAQLCAMVRQAVAKAVAGQAPHPRGQSTGNS